MELAGNRLSHCYVFWIVVSIVSVTKNYRR